MTHEYFLTILLLVSNSSLLDVKHAKLNFLVQTEISLCRVYKRTGVVDHLQLPGPLPSRPSSSRGTAKLSCPRRQLPGVDPSLTLVMEKVPMLQGATPTNLSSPILSTVSTASMEEDSAPLHHSKNSLLSSTNYSMTTHEIEELNGFVSYDHSFMSPPNTPSVTVPPQPQLAPLNQHTMSLSMISDKLWEWWNPLPEVGKDYSGFKWLLAGIYMSVYVKL